MSLLIQVHTITKELKGTCIYYGVIHTTILVQSEEGEERSALSEEDHTGLEGVLLNQVKGHPGFIQDFLLVGGETSSCWGLW